MFEGVVISEREYEVEDKKRKKETKEKKEKIRKESEENPSGLRLILRYMFDMTVVVETTSSFIRLITIRT